MHDTKCSNCGASDLVKSSVAHELGTTGLAAQSRAFGDIVGVSTVGVSQTLVATRLAPPRDPEQAVWAASAMAGLMGWLIATIILALTFPRYWWLGFVVGVACGAWLYRATMGPRTREYEDRLSHYRREWFCTRCGKVTEIRTEQVTA